MEERIAQLEKEVAKLKSDLSRVTLFERLARWLTMLGAVTVFAWGLYEHFDAIEQEFRKTFWQEQYTLYSEVTDVASTIAIADHLDSVKGERSDFWKLYWGKLSMVESDSVMKMMVRFGAELARQEQCDTCSRSFEERESFRDMSYDLARACRESLKRTWEPAAVDDIPDDAGDGSASTNDQ